MAIWPEAPSLAGSILISGADATVKVTIVLALAYLATRALRRSSAAVRHRIWVLAIGALIALPAVSWLVPGWRIPVGVDRTQPIALVAKNGPRPTPISVDLPRPVEPFTEVVPVPPAQPPVARSARFASRSWSIAQGLILLWAVGFSSVAIPTLAAMVGNERRLRRSKPILDPGWLGLLDELRDQLTIPRRVVLLQAEAFPVPLTWGVVRPVIAIPSDAGTWSEATRRLVLLHELAHVARFDVGSQLLGRFVAALYWFHPLVWFALARMRVECEHACDDRVIEAGVPPSDYADQLLNLARSFRTARLPMGLAMARTNTLEGRMIALFDDSRSHAPLPRSTARKLGLASGLILSILSMIHPGPSVAQPEQTPTLDPQPAQAPTPPLEAKGRIEGRVVVDADGNAAGAAKVILFGPPSQGQAGSIASRAPRTQVADASGKFAFEGLAAGTYRLWAYRDALSSRTKMSEWETVEVLGAGVGPKAVEFRLKPGIAWTVRVKAKASGKPIPGAVAHLRGFADDFIADAEGVALVRPLTAERYLVDLWAEGFAKVARWVDLADGGATEAEVLLEPGGNIAGIIRDSTGRPLDRVKVIVTTPRSGLALNVVESDANGRYRVEHLPVDESLDLQLVKESYKALKRVIRVKPAEQTFDFNLALRTDGGSVAGIVVDGEGRPIAGAEVSNRGDNPGERLETKTGPDGRFVLHNLFDTLRPQGKSIRVWARTMAPELVKVTTGPPDQPAEVKITLSPGHRITGRVLDDKKQPLAGARVTVSHSASTNRIEPPDDQLTDAEGRFAFDSLPLGSAFNVSKRGYPQEWKGPLPLDGATTVDVVLNPAGHIGGRVLNSATGVPVRSFNVRATFSRRRRPGDPSGGLGDDLIDPGKAFVTADGQFQIKDLTMNYPLQVMISAPGFEETVAERVVAVAPDDLRVEDFRLTPIDPANLENYAGRLIDAAGAPVVGVEVWLIALRNLAPGEAAHENDPLSWSEIRQWGRNRHPMVTRFLKGVTDDGGRWSFDQVSKDGEVELAWWGPGIAPGRRKHLEKLDPTGKANVETRVFPPSAIVATFDRQKYPTAAQVIFVNQDRDANDFQNRPTPVGASGFEIKNIAAGTYQVSLRPSAPLNPNRSNGLLRAKPLATKEVIVIPGETARVDFKD